MASVKQITQVVHDNATNVFGILTVIHKDFFFILMGIKRDRILTFDPFKVKIGLFQFVSNHGVNHNMVLWPFTVTQRKW